MSPRPEKVKGQPRVIFFDAAGTLIHPAQPVGATYAEVAQRFGAETSTAQMEAAFRQVWKELPTRPPATGPRAEDDRPWWEALANDVLSRVAQVPSSFDRAAWFDTLYRFYAEARAWKLYPDVIPALEQLSVRLAVISNFDGRLRSVLAGHGLAARFEQLFISSELGCEKPDAEIFGVACRAMDAAPSECWHVGDDPVRDWAGAADAGLRSIELLRPATTLLDLAAQWREVVEAQTAS